MPEGKELGLELIGGEKIWTYKKTYKGLNQWWGYLLKNNKINL
jgi:hypothetical protein